MAEVELPPTPGKFVYWMVAICAILVVAFSYGYTSWAVHASNAHFNRVEQMQREQGEAVEAKLCATLEAQSKLAPPAAIGTPSPTGQALIEYLRGEHDNNVALGKDLGCPSFSR
jgi:hypothetical protein